MDTPRANAPESRHLGLAGAIVVPAPTACSRSEHGRTAGPRSTTNAGFPTRLAPNRRAAHTRGMGRRIARHHTSGRFEAVIAAGLELPEVEVATKDDGTPVLRLHGCFLAGLASHPSAEPDTLVVRYEPEERAWLLKDAGDTYYTTDYYRRLPLVLARLQRLDRDALRDLLAVSWRLTASKSSRRGSPGKARVPASQRVGGRAPR